MGSKLWRHKVLSLTECFAARAWRPGADIGHKYFVDKSRDQVVGAVLVEIHHEWQVAGGRYLSRAPHVHHIRGRDLTFRIGLSGNNLWKQSKQIFRVIRPDLSVRGVPVLVEVRDPGR